jgi:hypothetical protein
VVEELFVSQISVQLDRYRYRPSPTEQGSTNPFRLVSEIGDPASPEEIVGLAPSEELRELWASCRSARLFEDVDYGQWGLVLLDPESSCNRTMAEFADRPVDLKPDDVVIGEFLGDQELLVWAPSEEGRRRVLVALPLDARADWWPAGEGIAEFLTRYFDANGEKFWERNEGRN